MRERAPRNRRGYTLIELILVITITGIIAGVVAPIIWTATNVLMFDQLRTNMVEDARFAMHRITRELSNIHSHAAIITAQDGNYYYRGAPWNATCPENFVEDSEVPPQGPRMRFSYANDDEQLYVTRCSEEPGLLADHMDTFRFTYLDGDGAALESPIVQYKNYTNIRTVRMEALFSDPNLGENFNYPYWMATEVRPKNLIADKDMLP